MRFINFTTDSITILGYGEIPISARKDLAIPAPTPGVCYIVHPNALAKYPDREDLYAPDRHVPGSEGFFFEEDSSRYVIVSTTAGVMVEYRAEWYDYETVYYSWTAEEFLSQRPLQSKKRRIGLSSWRQSKLCKRR